MNDKHAKLIAKREEQTMKELHDELNRLTRLGVSALTASDRRFIRARAEYLSEKQAKMFESVLNESQETPEQDDTLNLADLKERGDKVGVSYKVGMKKADFLSLIEEAEKAQEQN